jgi:exodeoxyribonuclease V alpha subunit
MATHSDVFLQFALAFPEPLVQPHAWLLAKRLQEGHICISLDSDPQLANGSPAGAYPTTQQLTNRPQWIGNAGDIAPFILHRNRLYLHCYF